MFGIAFLMALRLWYIASSCRDSNNISESKENNNIKSITTVPSSSRIAKHIFNNRITGLFPGWDEGIPIDRSELPLSKREFVPKRLIAVFGLESSGTTFVQETLAKALGAKGQYEVEFYTRNKDIRVQHFSLPTGVYRKSSPNLEDQYQPLPLVPVHVPYQCRMTPYTDPSIVQESPTKCHALFGPIKVASVERYFINVTSHIQFYQKRGIDTMAVIVVRDPAMHFRGITKTHCRGNQTAAYEQYKTGRAILQEAMEKLDPKSYILVSYETLMTLQQVYLKEIYKALRIQSTYAPPMKNGNLAYVPKSSLSDTIKAQLELDTGVIRTLSTIPKNLYEPKSYEQLRAEREKNPTTIV